jgi:hypothetical protein
MGAQACVLLSFFAAQYCCSAPDADLTYRELAAGATMRGLVWAVAISLMVIVPLLAYLIAVYKVATRPLHIATVPGSACRLCACPRARAAHHGRVALG